MAIPEFDENGLLPYGIYECTLDEIKQRFGRFDRSDQRQKLYRNLEAYMKALRKVDQAQYLLVNGSFVTRVAEPNDIDLIVVGRKGSRFPVLPHEYSLLSRQRVRRTYGLDLFVVEEGSGALEKNLTLFHRVRNRPELAKGLLRISL